jgi:hypothetical protein
MKNKPRGNKNESKETCEEAAAQVQGERELLGQPWP